MKLLEEKELIFFLQMVEEYMAKTFHFEAHYQEKEEKYGFLATPRYRFLHTLKVLDYGLTICDKEGGRREVVILSAIFHDLERFTTPVLLHGYKGAASVRRILEERGFPEELQEGVARAIAQHVGQENLKNLSLEGAILVEADRLDKIGSKGIMTYFMVSGRNNRDFSTIMEEYQEHLLEKGERNRKIFQTQTGRLLLEQKIREQESFYRWIKDQVVLSKSAFLEGLLTRL